jgi:two-component system sensor histidine kinase BarA
VVSESLAGERLGERAEDEWRLLAEAGMLLSSSLDVETTLASIARLAVPRLADWCVVYVLDDHGSIRRLALEHRGQLAEKVGAVLDRHPLDPDAEGGVPAVIRTGQPILRSEPSLAEVLPDAVDPDRLAAELPELVISSYLCVPMIARGRTLGAISLLQGESTRRFGPVELEIAEELARRAALAMDNALLYRAAGEQSALLDAVLASAPVGIGFWDRDLRYVRVNDALARLNRLPASEHLGKTLREVIPDFADVLEPVYRRVIESGEPLVQEESTEMLAPHLGTDRHWLSSYYPVRTPGGEVIGLGAVIMEITERRRLVRELEARAQAAKALEFVGDGIALVDREGVIRLWNPVAASVTGLRADEVEGRHADEAIPGWAELVDRVPVAKPEPGHTPRSETLPLEIGDRELWLSLTAVDFGEGTVFAFRDVTEERGLERLKSDFVSTVSHELRTPLAAVYGAALTLRRADMPLTDDQRDELLAVIANEADRLARIVDEILWASRIEFEGFQAQIESCDAANLAGAVVQAAQVHRPEDVVIDFDAPADLPHVAADRDKLRQVLANLLDNAVKYSPGGGRIGVRLTRRDGCVRILVSDEGLGIPAGERERIFEKFYRLDPDLTRGVGGTGLGLYISRELVRRMGGSIWVEPNHPRGSTFVVELRTAGEPPEERLSG